MIDSKDELFAELDSLNLPLDVRRIWDENLPAALKYTLQEPSTMLDAFVTAPEMFPAPDELLILWQTNGESIVGVLRESGMFVEHYLEDSPEYAETLAASYQQLAGVLLSTVVSRGADESQLAEAAEFLSFKFQKQLSAYVRTDPDWEGNVAAFVASLEKDTGG